jgi:hypothetical protein
MIKKTRDIPAIKDLCKQFNYRKHDVILNNIDEVELHGGYWDGGSRSTYILWDSRTGKMQHLLTPTAPPQFGGGPTPTIKVQPGTFVLCVGTFCGKTAHMQIMGPGAEAL